MEQILNLEERLGYVHKGIEKAIHIPQVMISAIWAENIIRVSTIVAILEYIFLRSNLECHFCP